MKYAKFMDVTIRFIKEDDSLYVSALDIGKAINRNASSVYQHTDKDKRIKYKKEIFVEINELVDIAATYKLDRKIKGKLVDFLLQYSEIKAVGITPIDRLLTELSSIDSKIKSLKQRKEEIKMEIEIYLDEIKTKIGEDDVD